MNLNAQIQALHSELGQAVVLPNSISAKEIPGRNGIFVGRNSEGDLLVLFVDTEIDVLPAKKYQNLRIEFSTQYQLAVDDTVLTKPFTLLKLSEADPILKNTFCTLMAYMIDSLPVPFSTAEVRKVVGKVVELFTAAPKVSRNAVVGLYGELALIRFAADANMAARSWHVSPKAKSDFTFGEQFIEVKTTEGELRKHRIRKHQLVQPEVEIYLASVKLTEDASGQNLLEFLNSILSTLSADNQAHVVETFFDTIGLDLEETAEWRFSVLGGSSEILVFKASDLPRPVEPDSRFSSALSGIEFELDFSALITLGLEHSNLNEIVR